MFKYMKRKKLTEIQKYYNKKVNKKCELCGAKIKTIKDIGFHIEDNKVICWKCYNDQMDKSGTKESIFE